MNKRRVSWTDMTHLIPIWAVFAFFDEQLGQAEAEYERAFPPGIRIIDPNEPMIPTPTRERFRWLSYVVRQAVDRAEDAGVGAVLARNLDDQLLEQVCLLGEQLYWQEWVNTVPRVLTEFAVEPFLRDTPGPGPGQISADFGVWCREQVPKPRNP